MTPVNPRRRPMPPMRGTAPGGTKVAPVLATPTPGQNVVNGGGISDPYMRPPGPAPVMGGGPQVSPRPMGPSPMPVSPTPGQPVLGGGPMVMPKPMKKGGTVSASKRADGIAQRGKTKGRMC